MVDETTDGIPVPSGPEWASHANDVNPLQPDLYRYVRLERGPADTRTMKLNHPLLSVDIDDFDKCGDLHDAIEEAREELEEAIVAQEWRRVIYRHDERYRVTAFCEYAHLLADCEYWEILGDLYRNYQSDKTLPDAYPEVLIFHHLLQSSRPTREFLMADSDRELFMRLPSSFTVYRGFARGDGSGISWTPDRRVAVFFAGLECFRSDGKHPPKILTARVDDRSLAYAFFAKEIEVLVPMRGLTVLSTDDVANEPVEHPTELTFDFEAWRTANVQQLP